MFCRHCGSKMPNDYKFCADCGTPILPVVNKESKPLYTEPTIAAAPASAPVSPYSVWAKQQQNVAPAKPVGKRKKTAGLLGIFLGFFGVHRFYLGYTEIAFIQIVLGVLGFATFGITTLGAWIWAIIDAVKIFKGKIDRDADENLLI